MHICHKGNLILKLNLYVTQNIYFSLCVGYFAYSVHGSDLISTFTYLIKIYIYSFFYMDNRKRMKIYRFKTILLSVLFLFYITSHFDLDFNVFFFFFNYCCFPKIMMQELKFAKAKNCCTLYS